MTYLIATAMTLVTLLTLSFGASAVADLNDGRVQTVTAQLVRK